MDIGLQGIRRGKPHRTRVPDQKTPCPSDKVNRQFRVSAPNGLWGRPSRRRRFKPDGRRFHLRGPLEGLCLVRATPSNRGPAGPHPSSSARMPERSLAGASAPRPMRASVPMPRNRRSTTAGRRRGWGSSVIRIAAPIPVHRVYGAARRAFAIVLEPVAAKWLVIAPSVGSGGDSCGNAPAETINGLFKAEVIHRRNPWRNSEAVEYAALECRCRRRAANETQPPARPGRFPWRMPGTSISASSLADPAADEGNAGARGHGASFRRRRARADRKNP